jgi:hypothetical protein
MTLPPKARQWPPHRSAELKELLDPFIVQPQTDRFGKPCGPTLLACSCCGAGKGEEHKRSCYVWSNKYAAHFERQRVRWNTACAAVEERLERIAAGLDLD